MKKVILKSLSLTNWKGEKQRTTEFNEVETTISGENGLGKTRHFDAFMWLLFGKDSQDRKDFNIKSIVDGKPLEKVECEVSGILYVDGDEISLRRAYVEDWVKPRGQVEQVFKGNHTETYWNDTPVNVSEYQKRINAIIDDSVFKMVTNPLFFANMKWQDQREQLFQLAGTITDNEIAAGNPEFATLLDRISGKSLVDFKRELSSRKKRLKDDLAQIQPRIDQTSRLMPGKEDYSDLERQLVEIDTEIATIDKSIADKTTAIRQQYEGVQAKQQEINNLKQKRQKVLFDEQNLVREAAFAANANRRELESNIKSTEKELETMQRGVRLSQQEVNTVQDRILSKKREIEGLRTSWYDENAKEYQGDDNCPECGQLLPEERRSEARQMFANNKTSKLSHITAKGGDLNKEVVEVEQDLANATKSLETAQKEIQAKRDLLVSLNQELIALPMVEESDIKPEEIHEYVQLTGQIKSLEATIDNGTEQIDTTDLQNRKKGFQQMRDEVKGRLASRDLISKYTAEIASLDKQGKDLAQQIADAEREEYTIQNFTKAKIDECERRINGLFSMVRFKLFDYTIDGNESETCIALVDGVPFPSVNTAGKVNAGLDIINALTRFYGVTAPIFIDGRESVNRLIKTESQIINLVVSHDKELIIK